MVSPSSLVTATWTFRRNLPLDNQMLYAAGRSVALTAATAAEFVQVVNGERKSVVLRNLYPRVWRLLGRVGTFLFPLLSSLSLSLFALLSSSSSSSTVFCSSQLVTPSTAYVTNLTPPWE
jgi:hypothetical protein